MSVSSVKFVSVIAAGYCGGTRMPIAAEGGSEVTVMLYRLLLSRTS